MASGAAGAASCCQWPRGRNLCSEAEELPQPGAPPASLPFPFGSEIGHIEKARQCNEGNQLELFLPVLEHLRKYSSETLGALVLCDSPREQLCEWRCSQWWRMDWTPGLPSRSSRRSWWDP
ncbi:uncharacterized protein LOC116547338 isoform X1 [Sapajus apella]|uniref:Uncharacterized protein LOC116547338 isoform X1 n=1 Tax=Sapajus apella TaxID=9515 RepID=A0A6J3HFC4_SAPAP|nr:uncharacterized protein LOC116547338 isoform X1 [Sapajus apella]